MTVWARLKDLQCKLNSILENLNDILVNIDINLTLDYQKL